MDSLCETHTKIIQNIFLFLCEKIKAKCERIHFLTLLQRKKSIDTATTSKYKNLLVLQRYSEL